MVRASSFGYSHLLVLVFSMIFLTISGVSSHSASADTVSSTIPGVTSNFININPNADKIYADNEHAFIVINASTNNVTATIPFGSSDFLGGLGLDSGNNKIYLQDLSSNSVHVIDGNTNSIIANITNIYSPSASGIVANPNTNKVYVAAGGLAVINGSTNTVNGYVSNACAGSANWFDVNPVTNKIYVACVTTPNGLQGRQALISIIDGSTDTVMGQINMAWNGQTFGGVAVNPATNTIYVTDFYNHVIYVFDGNTNTLTSTIPSSGDGFIAVNPVTNKVYATDGVNSVTVIDGSTNKVVQTLQVGNSPWQVSVDSNANKIYVANSGSNFVSIIDGSSSGISTTPSAPQNLQTTTGNAQISLSWTAPTSNGGSSITGYNVYRGTTSGGETLLTSVSASTTSYTDTTVTNGQAYYYQVTAVNSVGESAKSNEASATPAAPATAPSAPTGLSARAASSSQINLSWATPASNGGSAITGYDIERSADNGATWTTIVPNTGSTSTTYSDTGLAASTTYTYRVSAINGIGTSSPSNTASATTNAVVVTQPPGIILNNVQSTSGTASNQITLSSFNAGAGSNRLLVVGISANNNNVASITFGGVSLKQKVGSFNNNDAEFWYLKNPTGTGNIIVTMNGPTQAVVGAYSFSGVNQTSPLPTSTVRHNTTPNSPAISITTKFANDWVIDLPSIYGGSTLDTPTCTQQWDANVPNAITGASSSAVVPSPGTVSCKWVASSADFWDDVAVEIRAN